MIFVFVAFFQALQLTNPSQRTAQSTAGPIIRVCSESSGAGVLLLIAWVLATIVRALILRVFKAAMVQRLWTHS
jgi:hypothetical protein